MAGDGAVAGTAVVIGGLVLDLLAIALVTRWAIRRAKRPQRSDYPPLPGGPAGQFPTGEGQP